MLRDLPWWLQHRRSGLEGNDVIWLYAIMSNPEARWLTYLADLKSPTGPTSTFYAVRATQSHRGMDLCLDKTFKHYQEELPTDL